MGVFVSDEVKTPLEKKDQRERLLVSVGKKKYARAHVDQRKKYYISVFVLMKQQRVLKHFFTSCRAPQTQSAHTSLRVILTR